VGGREPRATDRSAWPPAGSRRRHPELVGRALRGRRDEPLAQPALPHSSTPSTARYAWEAGRSAGIPDGHRDVAPGLPDEQGSGDGGVSHGQALTGASIHLVAASSSPLRSRCTGSSSGSDGLRTVGLAGSRSDGGQRRGNVRSHDGAVAVVDDGPPPKQRRSTNSRSDFDGTRRTSSRRWMRRSRRASARLRGRSVCRRHERHQPDLVVVPGRGHARGGHVPVDCGDLGADLVHRRAERRGELRNGDEAAAGAEMDCAQPN
jgi:hypothetical protein